MASTSMMRPVLNSAHAKLEARITLQWVQSLIYWPIDTTRLVRYHLPITAVTLMEATIFNIELADSQCRTNIPLSLTCKMTLLSVL